MSLNSFNYLIIAGSTKCGTTSLFEYLAAHPQINPSFKKESRFFWTGVYPIRDVDVTFKDGIGKYGSIFTSSKKTNIRLEATPDYLYSEETAKLIKENLNNCKLIFVLRNPEERIISWYKFSKQLNLISSELNIDDFVKQQLNSSNENYPQHLRAVDQGRYGFYLKPWMELFGSENIFIAWYNQLSENPKQLMKDISNFAGIDPTFYNHFDFKVYNKSVAVKDAGSFNKYRTFRRNLRRILKSLPLGRLIKSALKPVDSLYMKNASQQEEKIALGSSTSGALQGYYADDKKLLATITNKSIPW